MSESLPIITSSEDHPLRVYNFGGRIVDPALKEEKPHFVPDHLLVSGDHVFFTRQGEGFTTGKLACFFRLHICNLLCQWCDTYYALDKRSDEYWTESAQWTIEEAKEAIESSWESRDPDIEKRLVITGGEPLLQQDSIRKLLKKMPQWFVEIETNGTIMPQDVLLDRCRFNCSPKLKNSGMPLERRIYPDVLQKLNQLDDTCFKFVAETAEDVTEARDTIIQPLELDTDKVVISPQGVTSKEVIKVREKLLHACEENEYHLGDRMQCHWYGGKRRH